MEKQKLNPRIFRYKNGRTSIEGDSNNRSLIWAMYLDLLYRFILAATLAVIAFGSNSEYLITIFRRLMDYFNK
jgi:hypothetical protein